MIQNPYTAAALSEQLAAGKLVDVDDFPNTTISDTAQQGVTTILSPTAPTPITHTAATSIVTLCEGDVDADELMPSPVIIRAAALSSHISTEEDDEMDTMTLNHDPIPPPSELAPPPSPPLSSLQQRDGILNMLEPSPLSTTAATTSLPTTTPTTTTTTTSLPTLPQMPIILMSANTNTNFVTEVTHSRTRINSYQLVSTRINYHIEHCIYCASSINWIALKLNLIN